MPNKTISIFMYKLSLPTLFTYIGIVCYPLFILSCSKETVIDNLHEEYGQKFQPQYERWDSWNDAYPNADYKGAVQATEGICLKGKSIAIIGGSLSCRNEVRVLKQLIYDHMGQPNIFNYGKGGCGCATSNISFQNLISQCGIHDIYIIWCSTNDYATGVPIGEKDDYTAKDGFNINKRKNQCGGLNYCIQYLKRLNPKALIIGYTSLQFFGSNANRPDGYLENISADNGQDITFYDYMSIQAEVFEQNNIPYLHQWNLQLFTKETYTSYYLSDGWHLSKAGYFLLGCEHLKFLSRTIKENNHD